LQRWHLLLLRKLNAKPTKGTAETNLWIGRRFTPTINRAINAAIQKAAARAVAHYVRCGKLHKSFRVED
jgi:hypothetical protein